MRRSGWMSLLTLLAAAHTPAPSLSGATPWYVTAAVATGAAGLGAVVGGIASHVSDVRLAARDRRFRAAVRRKSKVYVPLKLELQQLREAIGDNRHFNWGIDRSGDARRHPNEPVFVHWGTLVEDGRALFAVSTKVRERMEALADAVERFERIRVESGEVFETVGRPLYGELTGNRQFHTSFGGHAMGEVVRDRDELWRDWTFGNPDTSNFREFRERFNADENVQGARASARAGEEALLRAMDDAEHALDDGIARISRREEKEVPKD